MNTNNIQIFNNPIFGDLRTVIINEKEYFFGIDIATDLMYKRPRKAVIDHCKGVLNQDGSVLTQDGEPIIPEGDVYRLIIKAGQQGNSKEIKEKADKLEKWIFDDILPTLRKTGTYGRAKSTQEQITLLAQGTTELYEKVDTLEQRFNKFEDELPVTGADMDDIQSAIRKKGIEVMGGRSTNAYQDNSTRGYVYADIQRELRRQFGVKRYKEIKHKDVETAVNIVRKYELPLVLKDRVDMENAQGKLEL